LARPDLYGVVTPVEVSLLVRRRPRKRSSALGRNEAVTSAEMRQLLAHSRVRRQHRESFELAAAGQ